MSIVKTYLVIVFTLTGDMIRTTEYFGEEDVRHALDEVGIQWPAEMKEIHLVYEIEPPLTQNQLEMLTALKDSGVCTNFYIRDEITADIPNEDVPETRSLNQLKADFRRAIDDLKR